jgi:predicted RNA binding protein YcfA (HicA-like mRNA interferase family)
MVKLRRITGRELIAALERVGFAVVRVRGSHHFLKHPDGRTTVVPVHRGEILGIGLLTKILRDCEMNRDDLQAFL